MKNKFKCLLLLMLLSACTDNRVANETLSELDGQPKTFALNALSGDTLKSGVPTPVNVKIIALDSIQKPRTIKINHNGLTVKNAHPNLYTIPKNLTIIPVNEDSLRRINIEKTSKKITENYIINYKGDTLITGVPIPAKSKIITYSPSEPSPALPLQIKDVATSNLQFLNMDQDVTSTLVKSFIEDNKGNFWFAGGYKGAIKYNGKSFVQITSKQGLPISSVDIIYEDRKGNIWLGSYGNGVSLFDGTSFASVGESSGLSTDLIRTITEDRHGNIWFGTDDTGIVRYDGKSFTRFTQNEGFPDNIHVRSIIEDRRGYLWIGTDKGVFKYDENSLTQFTKKDGLPGAAVVSIEEDRNGNLWFGTDNGACRFDGYSFTHFSKSEGFTNDYVYAVKEDSKGKIWFCTSRDGVYRYDGISFLHINEDQGLTDNSIFSIIEDKSGNLWFGTKTGGVCRYDDKSFVHFSEKQGLTKDVTSIIEDESGNLWFGASSGGVSRYDGASFTNISEKDGFTNHFVESMLEDKSGNLWFGTLPGGVIKYNGESFSHFTQDQGLTNNLVLSIFEDKSGIMWFGTWSGINRYDGKTFSQITDTNRSPKHYITAINEDKSGNIWFGTNIGAIKYDQKTMTFFTEKEGLCSSSVKEILKDSHGNLLFSTLNGLSLYDGESYTNFLKNEGIFRNELLTTIQDKENNIWSGFIDGGLSRIDFGKGYTNRQFNTTKSNDLNIINYSISDGLKNRTINDIYLDSKNRLWCGHQKGVSMLDLNEYVPTKEHPTVYLNQLDLNDQFIDYRKLTDNSKKELEFSSVKPFENYPLDLELPYHQNHLTFHFSGIDWAAPHKIQYSYVMEGLNTEWSKPTAEPKADYRNLSHGTYTFKLRAIGESGQWSDPFEYSFTINPPWWHTWWARVLYLIVALSFIFGYIRWRTNTLKKQKASLEQTVKDRTIELEKEKRRAVRSEKYKEQFLANMSHEIRTPMHAISGMVKILKRNKHPKSQDAFLDAMQTSSDNLVVILNDVLDLSKIEAGKLDIESIPMSPTVIIENVIQILKYKAEEKGLHLNYKIDENVPDLIMGDPTRLNQILINLVGNAIKFTEKGRVDISLTKENDQLKFSIKDTGIGIPKEKVETIFGAFEQAKDSATRNYGGTGLGLNISKQLVKLQKGKIWVESIVNKGSTFFVELPLITAAKDALSQNIITDAKLQSMSASLKGLRILLAEDNSFNQMIAKDDLTYYIEDVSIDVVENGQLAVDKFKKGHYDLILMDVQMPEMNGFEASKKIREIEKREGRKNSIPIIAMTASLLKSEINNCYDAGMNNYIPKPYNAEELIGPIYTEKTRKI